MKSISLLLVIALFAGCAGLPPGTRTEAQKLYCGRPSMLGAEVVCSGQELPFIHANRTNADQRGFD